MVFEAHCTYVISMNRTLIIQLCQDKHSFPFYATFNIIYSECRLALH